MNSLVVLRLGFISSWVDTIIESTSLFPAPQGKLDGSLLFGGKVVSVVAIVSLFVGFFALLAQQIISWLRI